MKRKKFSSLLSVEELAEYLDLKKQTIYNWLNEGKIVGFKIGKVWRFKKEDIDNWLKECRKKK
ncbi:MAG: helix-turn-helix domain-containing protein [Candidatus Omnitrophica bacterium]|nr:helix-turn-helix domain-containing protein [Candidatus Omnitrophota bacterium]